MRTDHAPDDYANELRGDDEEPMNVKESPIAAAIISGLIVGVTLSVVNVWWPRGQDEDKATAAAIAALTTQVAVLTTEVKRISSEPYIRREEFEGRLSGLDHRVGTLESRTSSNAASGRP